MILQEKKPTAAPRFPIPDVAEAAEHQNFYSFVPIFTKNL
jgi:hypothetical protein